MSPNTSSTPRWRRLIAWVLFRGYSPSIGRTRTFRECWTGVLQSPDMGEAAALGFEEGFRSGRSRLAEELR